MRITGIILITLVFALFAGYFYQSNLKVFPTKIALESEEIFNNDEVLYSYIKDHGPKQTITRLNELSTKFGSCHDVAHKAGRFAYEIYQEKAFQECSAECHSGCYHGATEGYFRDHGTANLDQKLGVICSSDLNAFFSHQCLHGVGHGLMAWTNYEIFEALDSCNVLSKGQDSCWTGVFMENIVGGLTENTPKDQTEGSEAHLTRYLSADPQYPCNIVDEKYKSSCYFLQSSRMVQLFGSDFGKISQACLDAPKEYQSVCFQSMGRDIGGIFRGDPNGAIKACASVPEGSLRRDCLIGAVQDSFWDASGQNMALNFCKLLDERLEKDACYGTIFERAPQLLVKNELNSFCLQAESVYQSNCLSYIK